MDATYKYCFSNKMSTMIIKDVMFDANLGERNLFKDEEGKEKINGYLKLINNYVNIEK